MKKYIFILSLLFTSQTFGLAKIPIPVVGISNTDMSAMYNLDTRLKPLKVVLDCQSFLHGVNLYQQNSNGDFVKEIEFYLYESECYEIYNFVKKRSDQNQSSCIVLDTDKKSYELYDSCTQASQNI
ncbi:MAG: hypothetical protein HN576_00435 [Bacteriovoracaceae bacterium]|jgi:hypothetical protein|nr:hypothetical protein [Bacteriovoracaceae bacterium]